MFLLNNRKINIDAQLTVNDTTYPNLRDPALREALGVTEVPDPVYPDPELFYWTENEDGTLTVTPKSDEQIAQQNQSKLNTASLAYLADTDWYVTRFAETGVAIPDDVKSARSAARAAIVK
jgi:hypothetical protein